MKSAVKKPIFPVINDKTTRWDARLIRVTMTAKVA